MLQPNHRSHRLSAMKPLGSGATTSTTGFQIFGTLSNLSSIFKIQDLCQSHSPFSNRIYVDELFSLMPRQNAGKPSWCFKKTKTNQLRLVVSPRIYWVLYISGDWFGIFEPSTIPVVTTDTTDLTKTSPHILLMNAILEASRSALRKFPKRHAFLHSNLAHLIFCTPLPLPDAHLDHSSDKANIWFGRTLSTSSRDNLICMCACTYIIHKHICGLSLYIYIL